MKPVVLLVGKLPYVLGSVARELSHLPVEWLGAHDVDEVIQQLDSEPRISTVIIGGSLDDRLRGDLVCVILRKRPDLRIHVKDRASGPGAMLGFVRQIVESETLPRTEAA